MRTCGPHILDSIAGILMNSKGLLAIEEWQRFELDFSTPVEEKNSIFKEIKRSIDGFKNINGIYAIFNGDLCLYIGKGKPIWSRIKSHYLAAQGNDKAKRWANFFEQYQQSLSIFWVEYRNLDDPALDDKLRELFEHVLQKKYEPLFNKT